MLILIIPFEDIEREVIETLKDHLPSFIKAKTSVYRQLPLPNCRWSGQQANATDFIEVIREAAALEAADYAVGVTKTDLYDFFNPELNYLFGFASGNSCIISTARLQGDFLKTRVLKEAVHQLGRCLGIDHCEDRKCVMFNPNSVNEVDGKNRGFCSKCKEKLKIK
ncbi:MAG TPA: hypothetical protein VJC00_01485 [Candidatus Nanoarchaeia archaeon]|nr:hypothetical protein [Candidatus Nanoarchaeia archaeon]